MYRQSYSEGNDRFATVIPTQNASVPSVTAVLEAYRTIGIVRAETDLDIHARERRVERSQQYDIPGEAGADNKECQLR